MLTGTTISGKKIAVRRCDLFQSANDEKVERKDSY